MDYTSLKSISITQDWSVLLPEIILCLIGLFLLLGDVLVKPSMRKWLVRIATTSTLLLTIYLTLGRQFTTIESGTTGSFFGGMLNITPLSEWFRVFFLVVQLGVFWIAGNYFKNRPLVKTEFYALISFVTASMMLLGHSQHFVILFVALETITIGLYVLVSYDRNSSFSLESALKFLILGGTNTAILLLGIVLIYGSVAATSGNSLQFDEIRSYIEANPGDLMVQLGALAILASVAFKVGLVPFHIWIPDVYQGAPTPTTAFLAIASKTAGFVLLFLFFGSGGLFQGIAGFLFPIILWVTIASMIYGNMTALGYTNLKRLLGMSGVSHAAFLMMGVLVIMQEGAVDWISGALLFYLTAYLLASMITFGVMSVIGNENDEEQDLYDYNELSEKRPFLAVALTLGIGSLAGIPPLMGFIAKFSLFVAAFQSELLLLLLVALLSVVISIFYYFKWIRELFYKDPIKGLDLEDHPQPQTAFNGASKLDLAILTAFAVIIVILGVYPMNLMSLWSFV